MSTFDGRIKEYPTIAIDNFKDIERPEIFILSHTHTDHTRGLENIEFNKKLYCSEKTARILPLAETRKTAQLKYKHLAGYVQPVPYYDPISITTRKHGVVHLTFYPAHHCPGSAMILIEGENGNVLYTGDMRAEKSFIREKLGTLQHIAIKNLYIDTTCCYSDKRYFITKEESCNQLVHLIDHYRKFTIPHVYLDNWTTGYEKIWRTIRMRYNSKVHVSQNRYNFYTTLSEKYQDILTTDPNSTRFHSCRWDEGCYKYEKTMISIHLTPNRNKKWMSYNPSKESRKLLQTDLPFGCNPVQRFILPFSTHSSLMEIVDFLKFVKPDKFFPCVAHGGWRTMSDMRELLHEEGCFNISSSVEISANASSSLSASGSASLPILPRKAVDSQSSAESTIRFVSTAEQSAASAVHSNPLSENNNNKSNSVNNSSSHQFKITDKAPVICRASFFANHTHTSSNENIVSIPFESHISSNENIVSIPLESHTSSHKLHRSQPHTKSNASHKVRVSLSLPHIKNYTSTGDNLSCYKDESMDSNMIVLSIPSTHDEQIYEEPEKVEYCSEFDDYSNRLTITAASARRLKKSISSMRKKQRKNRGTTVNNPIVL